MDKIKSCGVVVFRREPALSFLLLRHPHRYDLPKGHVEQGEGETDCALRELAEETGLTENVVRLEDGFRWATTYYPRYRGRGGQIVEKTVVIFLGWLLENRTLTLTEHTGYEWLLWRPPHRLAQGTIDGALAAVERYFSTASLQPQQPPG